MTGFVTTLADRLLDREAPNCIADWRAISRLCYVVGGIHSCSSCMYVRAVGC